MDVGQCREFLRRRAERRQAGLDEQFARAWREFRTVTSVAIEKYHPQRLYQWGSLLNRARFWERSDIDLAVEGLTDAARFFALYAEADRLTSFPLDLVQIERVEPEYAELIRKNGRLVYDRACPNRHAA